MIEIFAPVFILGLIITIISLAASLIIDYENNYSTMFRVLSLIVLLIVFFSSNNVKVSKYKYNQDRVDEAVVQYSNEFILIDSLEQIAIHKKDSSIYRYDGRGKYIKL